MACTFLTMPMPCRNSGHRVATVCCGLAQIPKVINKTIRSHLHWCMLVLVVSGWVGASWIPSPPSGVGVGHTRDSSHVTIRGWDKCELLFVPSLVRWTRGVPCNQHTIMLDDDGTGLMCVHCAVRSTPPHFVVNLMKFFVQSLLTHTPVGTKWLAKDNTCQFC